MRSRRTAGETGAASSGGAAGHRDQAIYDRHGIAIFRQALLMLDDERLAEQVACDVIAAERAQPATPPGEPDGRSRLLAASTLRRCQDMLAAPARQARYSRVRPAPRHAGRAGLDSAERALLGLVLFGGMAYSEAARELAISPARAAASLRTALLRLGSSPNDLPRMLSSRFPQTQA